MGFKLKIGKLKISAKNPVKAIAKVITAPLVAPTLAAVAVVDKKTAEKLAPKDLGYNKDDIAGLKIGGAAVLAVAAPLALSAAAASVPAAAAVKKAADEAAELKKKAEEALKVKEAEKLKAKAEAAAKAAEAAALAALPKPPPPLPPAPPPAAIDPLFVDNSPTARAKTSTPPATIQAAAAGKTREMDFLEKFFAWLAGKV